MLAEKPAQRVFGRKSGDVGDLLERQVGVLKQMGNHPHSMVGKDRAYVGVHLLLQDAVDVALAAAAVFGYVGDSHDLSCVVLQISLHHADVCVVAALGKPRAGAVDEKLNRYAAEGGILGKSADLQSVLRKQVADGTHYLPACLTAEGGSDQLLTEFVLYVEGNYQP